MATLEIVELLTRSPGLTDREITNLIKGRTEPQQPVNTTCRELATKGVVERRRRADGLIGNYLTGRNTPQIAPAQMQEVRSVTANSTDELSEDALKKILAEWLERDGWTVKIAWGGQRGLDIEAVKGAERWCIEAKGCGSRQPMRVNYFLAILGETLQRMDDPKARYSIALPDMAQFRGLWARLPRLAKERLDLTVLFVTADGRVRQES